MSMTSEPLRISDTNSASDSQGSLGPIQYQNLWLVLAALALSLALLLMLSIGTQLAFRFILAIAAIPLALALAFTWICQTQPPGYFTDLVTCWFIQPAFGLEPLDEVSE